MSKLSCYIKCPNCGNRLLFINNKDYITCTYCGHTIFRNEKSKFKYELEKRMMNEKRTI